MDIRIQPAPLAGTVKAIGSKSDIHRLMICAALADKPTEILGVTRSDDVESTAACLYCLGAAVSFSGSVCTIRPVTDAPAHPVLDCRESGSTFRFLLPVAAVLCASASFTGGGRLPDRPIADLIKAIRGGGVEFTGTRLPFSISGKLRSGDYVLPGNVSSQYISGLLMALTAVPGESRVRLSSTLESSAYVDMTLSTLQRFGADAGRIEGGYSVSGGRQLISPGIIASEGDWSNAAFFLASGAIGGGVTVTGLNPYSVQGDRKIADVLRRFGADVRTHGNAVTVLPGTLRGCEIDIAETPDLLPVLAVAAAFAEGETRFLNGSRLRLKESDRLKSVSDMLRTLGGSVNELPDGLIIHGKTLTGGVVNSAGDHRIVMAAAIAAAHATGSAVITGAQAVSKSYTSFFEEFAKLGGRAHVV